MPEAAHNYAGKEERKLHWPGHEVERLPAGDNGSGGPNLGQLPWGILLWFLCLDILYDLLWWNKNSNIFALAKL